MKVEEVKEADFAEIVSLIKGDFPYVSVDRKKIGERLSSGKIFVLKAVEGEKLLGFIEAELLEAGVARINGLTVKEEFRGKGTATLLLDGMLALLKKKKMRRVMLLVKQGNSEAKNLYQKKGFKFMGLYQRELDNSVVEEMELDLEQSESPGYVN